MIKKHKLWLFGVVMIIVLSLAVFKHSQAQTTALSTDADAIAVRIIPNPNHYSIVRWYENQGFSGAPQALTVDGYEAIRDGRTVYVNAANADPVSRTVYTNIYLISYNQDSTSKTVDILGQIVAHWKFNNNVKESTDPIPNCSISAIACNLDTDCGSNQYCATSSAGIASSSCLLKTPVNCLVDTDCPNNFFCSSIKSKITRDIKRIGQLEELKEALFNFKKHNNYYPRLSSGTYLSNNSLSVWPSWTQSFLSEVAVSQNLLDPINRLGACPGYDVKTCWNPDLKKFIYAPTGATLVLPAGSFAFAYSTDVNGSNYNLCAVMESRAADLRYHFLPVETDPTGSSCVTATGIVSGGSAENTAPQLVDQFLVGQANKEFSGFLKVVDAENNPLVWKISGPAAAFLSLRDTSDPTQKKVYAANAGQAGTYDLVLTVSDGRSTTTAATKVTILADAPRIEAADAEYILDPKVPFNYSFTFSSKNLNTPSAAYTVTRTSGLPDVLNGLGLAKGFATLTNNSYKVVYANIIPTFNKFYQDTSINYRIDLKDANGKTYPKTFNIKIIVEQPQLDFNCAAQTRVNKDYVCLLGSKTQGNHTLSYGATGLPSGLSLGGSADAIISGSPTAISSGYPISIKATNEYGASTSKAFVLKVNNYCGDGIKQSPNTENRGGAYNDGYENCDGIDGTTSNISTSSALQYGCRTEASSTVPNPILTNTYCVFKSPAAGGGYCGDGYCQSAILPTGPESPCNCPQDCGEQAEGECVCQYSYSAWGACGSDHFQTRSLLTALPGGCTGTPVLSRSCGYACTYSYSAWGACGSDKYQARTVFSSSPENCVGTPVLSQACVCDNNGTCDANENPASCSNDCKAWLCSPACPTGQTCDNGTCKTSTGCTPACTGKKCGADGCGGSCGTCLSGTTCNTNGVCVCQPNCTNKSCGDSNGCGGYCTDCAGSDEMCRNNQCVFDCTTITTFANCAKKSACRWDSVYERCDFRSALDPQI